MNNYNNVRCPRCGSCEVKLIETITRNKQCGCEVKTEVCCVYKCCCCGCKFKKRVKPQPPCQQPIDRCKCNNCRPIDNCGCDCGCNKWENECGCGDYDPWNERSY